jgi:hypothetical protein
MAIETLVDEVRSQRHGETEVAQAVVQGYEGQWAVLRSVDKDCSIEQRVRMGRETPGIGSVVSYARARGGAGTQHVAPQLVQIPRRGTGAGVRRPVPQAQDTAQSTADLLPLVHYAFLEDALVSEQFDFPEAPVFPARLNRDPKRYVFVGVNFELNFEIRDTFRVVREDRGTFIEDERFIFDDDSWGHEISIAFDLGLEGATTAISLLIDVTEAVPANQVFPIGVKRFS